ncbi:hypothetical protein SCHPADRAFT_904475 [Schizopora paradoxa]|uniref:Uncharacterized protein n=1 Tax=Schizopora paradoxa TaxID=27342 RepID=A0A0H2RMJ7_9AGAM|nr:hypothetical protein SCHPADRAFT_904475 [Schizopora paradoxa]
MKSDGRGKLLSTLPRLSVAHASLAPRPKAIYEAVRTNRIARKNETMDGDFRPLGKTDDASCTNRKRDGD